jgi:hypothetical protein
MNARMPSAPAYRYPVMPAATVPAMRRRRVSQRNLFIIALVVTALVSGGVTTAAVLLRPGTDGKTCGFFCGPPKSGTPLEDVHSYTSPKYGFAFDFLPDFTKTSEDSESVEFTSKGGPVRLFVGQGSADQLIQDALDHLPSASFRGVKRTTEVRGAQIGYAPGKGTVFDATFSSSSAGQSVHIRGAVLVASRGKLTMVATMFCPFDKDAGLYGMSYGQPFDFMMSSFRWPSQ